MTNGLDDVPGQIHDSVADAFGDAFTAMGWAEDEIEAAQRRHGETGRGPIWRQGFAAVRNTNLIWSERLYRAHCREILNRIPTGSDLRPGTDAEIINEVRQASLRSPMQPGFDCLYFRLFARCLPELRVTAGITDDVLSSYERLHGSAADDHERYLRGKLSRDRSPEAL